METNKLKVKLKRINDDLNKINSTLQNTSSSMTTDSAFEILWQKYGSPSERQKAEQLLYNKGEIEYKHAKDINYKVIRIKNPDKYNNSSFYEQLSRRGTAITPIIDLKELSQIQKDFLETIHTFPEYKRSPIDSTKTPKNNPLVYVTGGFGALGNPASFHNLLVRRLRKQAYYKLLEEMKIIKQKRLSQNEKLDYKLETLFDRMMYRLKGMAPPAEAWHRDVMPDKLIKKRMKSLEAGLI